MSNFAFLKDIWPDIYEECTDAESYVLTDPKVACLYSRRAIELLVPKLYGLMKLKHPYRDDLNAHISDSAFTAIVGNKIRVKLELIRTRGNRGAHPGHKISDQVATNVVSELFHVMVWAVYSYTTKPAQAPQGKRFHPDTAMQRVALSADQVQELIAEFKRQDEENKRLLEESEAARLELEREVEHQRQKVAEAQAAKSVPDTHDYREDETRDAFIDLLLHEAGWPLNEPDDREYEVTGLPTKTGKGRADYVLWGEDGRPLAVVEAKRSSRSPELGQEQARLYADALEKRCGRRPIIYYTNGTQHYIWDDATGYPPRRISGFHTADQLELMIQRRETRKPLESFPVDTDIAGRPYQIEALKAVDQAFDAKQRQALLVMATGTGKTRVSVALVKQLMDAGWVKRALFLADRTALVKQAHSRFVQLFPESAPVNLLEDKNGDGRVYLSTYPTIMNLLDKVDATGLRKFGTGFFDLVIIDEAHRSIYAKYGYLFEHFDAYLVGLTATPKDEIDRNTYRLFHLEDGVPTAAYDLERAIAEGFLVPPLGVSVGTTFLRRGITYADLTEEEKDQWDELDWGEDGAPESVDSEEMNSFLFNDDTVDQVLAILMERGHKVNGGDRIAKTIIFAKNQRHADHIAERFNVNWPELGGEYARVIASGVHSAHSLIEKFENPAGAPFIAISVDMLDTGIDIPEVANLVFFKTVHTPTKFWQMIGRGTRLCKNLYGEGQDKKNFYVFDFCGNLEFFQQDFGRSESTIQKSLTQRIFDARVSLIRTLDRSKTAADVRTDTADTLHTFVCGMTLNNVTVRPHREAVEKYSKRENWDTLTVVEANEVAELGKLPTAANWGYEPAKRFDLLILNRQLVDLTGDTVMSQRTRETTMAIAEDLLTKTNIPEVAKQAELLEDLVSEDWWVDVTTNQLERVRKRLRDLAGLVDTKGKRNPVYTDFQDTITSDTTVELSGATATTGMDWNRFLAKTSARLKEKESNLTIQRLRRNLPLTPGDLKVLEDMLLSFGADTTQLDRARSEFGGLGLFVRSLVGLDKQAVTEAFAQFLNEQVYNVEQIRFVNMIIDELTSVGVMKADRLFEAPYTDNLPTGPTDLFKPEDVKLMAEILDSVRRRAEVEEKVA